MKLKAKVVEKINEKKSWFFEKIKALAALTEKNFLTYCICSSNIGKGGPS